MGSNEEYFNLKPPPPPNLSKENVGVWTGWCCKGDKEVAREAATKGIKVDLVVLFISLRKKLKLEEAEEFFKNEVLLWVKELLDRQQIFRVTHVLKNIGLNPEEELSKFFYTSTSKKEREYIGNHLESQNKLDENVRLLWNFLNLIQQNSALISKYTLAEDSIACLERQSSEWKAEVAAKLFLRTYDTTVQAYLSGEEVLWKQLLTYNDAKLLKLWINVRYNDTIDTHSVPDSLLKTFKLFPITNNMINQLSFETSADTCRTVLKEFSKFGIFCDKDKNDLVGLLSRLNQSDNIQHIYKILAKNTSNISENTFINLLTSYCSKHNLFTVLSACTENTSSVEREKSDSIYLDLILDFRKLTKDFSEAILRDNILNVSTFLSNDLNGFFRENPLILLSLILFTDNMELTDVLNGSSLIISDVELSQTVTDLRNSLKTVNAIYDKIFSAEISYLSYYELLERHLNINVKELYAFRLENSPVPDFSTPDIVQTYGYSKQLNYVFYLKQCRPSVATKLYCINLFSKYKHFPDEVIKLTQKKVYKLALKNFRCTEITTSCVAVLEMIGINSEFLKVVIKAANILFLSGQDQNFVTKLFLDIENDPYAVLKKLETTVVDSIDFESFDSGSSFVEAVKTYDIVVKFATLYNLKPPELFLKHCASNNMWLPFLIFAQIKNYPVEQVKVALQSLKNPNLLEHINHSVVNDIQTDEQNILMRERDSRKYFLSRIGVRKSIDSLNQSESLYSSIGSQSSLGSSSSSTGSDFLEIDISNTKATLLQTLIRCHNSTDPPRALLQACQLYKNPLLAIFATSYEPDSLVTNWLTWLAVSSELYQTFTNFESIAICAQSVAALLNNCMKHRYPKVLLQSFEIFIPDNPLKYFLEFLNTCIYGNLKANVLVAKLEAFKKSLGKCRRYSVLLDNDHEMIYLTNKIWIERTALLLLSSAIEYNLNSLYEQIQLLQDLCDVGIENFFNCPNLKNLVDILRVLYDSKCEVTLDVSSFLENRDGRKAVIDCINKLLDCELFEDALRVAQIEGLPLDLILIKQWQYKFQSRTYTDPGFWQNSNEDFIKYIITADCVIEFYMDYVDKVDNNCEKYHILKLAHDWARKFELSSRYEIEKRKWLAFIVLDEKLKNLDEEVLNDQPRDLTYKEMLEMLTVIARHEEEIPIDALNLLHKVVNTALNKGNFWLALKLEKMFDCGSSDLQVLKLGHSLAEGITMPYQLDTEQRSLIAKGAHFRGINQKRTLPSSYSSASLSSGNIFYLQPTDAADAQDTLALLCTLADKLTDGSEIGYRLYMTYRISKNIEIPYHVVVSNSDHLKMLKDALEDDCVNKREVVHDFICVYEWTKEETADFICEEIVKAASDYVQSKSDTFVMWDLQVDQDFHLVLQLLQDNCSLLGYKIYSYASTVHKVQVSISLDFKISELALVVELLIRAHDCFTADCNMEGISIILKKSQTVISHLLTLRSWKLIVRLLTGVARYTEMNYVFHILRENDQFEFLLRKGSRKDNGLKVALLEYLKKYCPDNRELYKIVALHFTLFSEVALLWEREAQSIIRNLIAISKLEMQNNRLNPDSEPFILFTNTDGTKICLNKAIENYTHATEFHLQGEKLAKAMNAARQAELIALQISLLKGLHNSGTAICLLNLNQAQIATLISSTLSFDQSLILVQAYTYEPDWAAVLFEQCISRGNFPYLVAFLKHRPLTDGLVHDISRKFLASNINTTDEINNMKKILTRLPSVHTKYRIASELGFTDLVEDLIKRGQLAYLKDTVWKRGYKN